MPTARAIPSSPRRSAATSPGQRRSGSTEKIGTGFSAPRAPRSAPRVAPRSWTSTAHCRSELRAISERIPGASFDEVERELLSPFEGSTVIDAISPRVFEAAALGTAMVNFVGRYSDVIEPWVHYVPLEKDFSNFGAVLAAIEDDEVLEPIASRAHADLVASGEFSLRRFVEGFDLEIEARARSTPRQTRPRAVRTATHSLLRLERLAAPARRAERHSSRPPARARSSRTETRLLDQFPGDRCSRGHRVRGHPEREAPPRSRPPRRGDCGSPA